MEITGSVAVVTGANRGLGRHFAAELLTRGAAKVRGGPRSAGDATLAINNAGISTHTRLSDASQAAALGRASGRRKRKGGKR